MSDKEYSPKLRAAMHEVAEVLKKHDVGGIVILNDGQRNGEYRIFWDTPTWTTLRFVKGGDGIHFKGYAKSLPAETNRTVNMIWNQLDILGQIFMMTDKVKQMIGKHLNVEADKGSFFHGPYEDGK